MKLFSRVFMLLHWVYDRLMPSEPLYTTKEVAEKLGISRQRVHILIKDGRLKAQKFGRVWLVPESAIDNIGPSTKRMGRPPKKRRKK